MRLTRTIVTAVVATATLATWPACSSSSTTDKPDAQGPLDDPCNDATSTYLLDPNTCCGANCTDGAMCDIQLFEGYELNTCINGTWVTTGQLSDHAPDAAALPDSSIVDATGTYDDGATIDASEAGADVIADAPPDVADAPSD